MTANRLAGETSPYLLQHKDNPVHWHPWDETALAAARAENKPILLSIGYAACHWCHVMAHESFENPAIAGLMNELFVSIKVDREERPDLDAIYQHALALLGEQGGWPLTMFLTPSGEPFWGGTYFPPTARWGRPGFPEVLQGLAAAWREQQSAVQQNVAALKDALARLSQPKPGALPGRATLDAVAERLVREIDPFHGGLGDAPKFPQVPIFELIWRGWKRSGAAPMRDAVLVTLDRMCQGGIYDHLGGGFARYATDRRWLVPHFEKMLYDNAQLIGLLTLVWQDRRQPLYAARIAETVDWLQREMTTAEGAFASSLDADSEHEEGKFYVWSEAEIDAVLGEEASLFKRHYDVGAAGNWEGKTILNRLKAMTLADEDTERRLADARAKLLAARAARIRPGLDDKVLADWNGLMIAALAEAAAVFDRADWRAMAERAFAFIMSRMRGADGRLFHAWRQGRGRHAGTLDDYANLARAALALFETTGAPAHLRQAQELVAVADAHHWDEAGGGYFFTPADAADVIARTKSAFDAAVPSGNGTMIAVLARLYYLTGEERYRQRAEATAGAFAGEIERNIIPLATFLNAVELLQDAVQIVIVGPAQGMDTAALRRAALDVGVPNRILVAVADAGALPADHPASGKTRIDGRAAAYVCVGPTCSLPLTDGEALAQHLREPHRAAA